MSQVLTVPFHDFMCSINTICSPKCMHWLCFKRLFVTFVTTPLDFLSLMRLTLILSFLVLASIVKQNNNFHISFQKCKCIFPNFEPFFVEKKIIWDLFFVCLFFFFEIIFGHMTILAKRKFVFWSVFWKKKLLLFFWYMVVLRVYAYGAGLYTKIPTGKYSKMVRFKLGPLCTNGSEKKPRHLSVLTLII